MKTKQFWQNINTADNKNIKFHQRPCALPSWVCVLCWCFLAGVLTNRIVKIRWIFTQQSQNTLVTKQHHSLIQVSLTQYTRYAVYLINIFPIILRYIRWFVKWLLGVCDVGLMKWTKTKKEVNKQNSECRSRVSKFFIR